MVERGACRKGSIQKPKYGESVRVAELVDA